MGENSAIAWCDHTFNGWHGCARVSEGCRNCYAETSSKRWGFDIWGADADRRILSDANWRQPLKWDRDALATFGRPALVFCSSMADVFEDRRDLDPLRERLAGLIEATPNLRWLLLTKRPENVARLAPWANAWPATAALGVSAENHKRAVDRIDAALEIPAPMHFVSAEPLLEGYGLGRWCGRVPSRLTMAPLPDGSWATTAGYDPRPSIDWVICGGESGPRRRPLNVDHARQLRDNCALFEVAFFFKQVGGRWAAEGGDRLDGVEWKQFPAWAERGSIVAGRG